MVEVVEEKGASEQIGCRVGREGGIDGVSGMLRETNYSSHP